MGVVDEQINEALRKGSEVMNKAEIENLAKLVTLAARVSYHTATTMEDTPEYAALPTKVARRLATIIGTVLLDKYIQPDEDSLEY